MFEVKSHTIGLSPVFMIFFLMILTVILQLSRVSLFSDRVSPLWNSKRSIFLISLSWLTSFVLLFLLEVKSTYLLLGVIGVVLSTLTWKYPANLTQKKAEWIFFLAMVGATFTCIIMTSEVVSRDFLSRAILISSWVGLIGVFCINGNRFVHLLILAAGILPTLITNDTFFCVGGLVISAVIALCAYSLVRLSILTYRGVLAAGLLASVVVSLLGWIYLLFPLFFLLLGSLMSKISVQGGKTSSDKDGRSAVQVFSNGLPALICAIAYAYVGAKIFVVLFVLSFAVALSDTMSSEGGRIFGTKTIDIITWKPIKKGLSGGVSASGTLLGLIGSMIICMIAVLTLEWDIKTTLFVLCFGFMGMLIDSLLGSLLQGKALINGYWTEDKIDHADKGYLAMDNDFVNMLSNVITLLLAGFLYYLVV